MLLSGPPFRESERPSWTSKPKTWYGSTGLEFFVKSCVRAWEHVFEVFRNFPWNEWAFSIWTSWNRDAAPFFSVKTDSELTSLSLKRRCLNLSSKLGFFFVKSWQWYKRLSALTCPTKLSMPCLVFFVNWHSGLWNFTKNVVLERSRSLGGLNFSVKTLHKRHFHSIRWLSSSPNHRGNGVLWIH